MALSVFDAMEVFSRVEDEEKRVDPENWVDYLPLFGLGRTKPNHYLTMLRTFLENIDNIGYAFRILANGVCDGCALGTSGMEDWTVDGIHLCSVRLNLLRMNTRGPVDPEVLLDPVELREKSSKELREMGRLPHPMIWESGEYGYKKVSWEKALSVVANRMEETVRNDPDQIYTYLTSKGIPNETYYAVQKTCRWLGTNNVDDSARICHSPSAHALNKAVGDGASSMSYRDWIGTDLLILIGANVANNMPVAMKYIYHAKKAGTKVIVINPYKEEGLDRYWIPSDLESAMFGTKIMDEFYQVQQGGDIAFFNGALKTVIEEDLLHEEFVENHAKGFDEVREYVTGLSWSEIEEAAGLPEEKIREFGRMYGEADTSVSVWAMGITQHSFGTRSVHSIINLALACARVGREKTGLNPIRGHSGVQGGAEMGAVPSSVGKGLPVTDSDAREEVEEKWSFSIPAEPGLPATDAIHEMYEGNIDLFYSMGGKLLETLPQPDYVRQAIEEVPVRVFQDVVIEPQMLFEPDDVNVILPAKTRYEMEGGVTETSTERRVIYSPEIEGPRIGEARADWKIFRDIARRVRPDEVDSIDFDDTHEIRKDISSTIEAYRPIRHLSEKGDQFQWGGERLYGGYYFNTEDEKARFVRTELPEKKQPDGTYYVTTRRGSQFNSNIWEKHDKLTGADRDDVFMSEEDAEAEGLRDGDPVLLRSDHGEFEGKIRITSRMKSNNLQVHWPEGEALIETGNTDPESGIPEYDAFCELIKKGDEAGDEGK